MAYSDSDFLEDSTQATPPSPWKSILTLILMVVLGLVFLRVLMALIIPILSIVLLIANRDLVYRIVRLIGRLYEQELYKGLLATIAAIFLVTPFLIFLFFRTVYYLFANPEKEEGRLSIDLDSNRFEDRIEHLFGEDNHHTH